MKKQIEAIKKQLTKKSEGEGPLKSEDLLSSGCTLINLACSGRIKGAFPKGKFIYLVGDSTSGKTFLSLTMFAEACRNLVFQDYRLIYNNGEDGALMDWDRFFGSIVAKRVEQRYSSSIEELYDDLDDVCKDGRPFIYVQDSMDSLTSEAENEKFQEQKKARRKGREVTGTFGDGKAKKNSANLRRILPFLRDTGSILLIISQTRDNLGYSPDPKTRSGGRALKFYATLELWSSVAKKLKKTIHGNDRPIGITCKVQVKKNRLTGKDRTVTFPIYNSVGIDDVGGNVAFLLAEKYFGDRGGKISAPEFDFSGSLEGLVKHIEKNGLESKLQRCVGKVWREIEDACTVERKIRYV